MTDTFCFHTREDFRSWLTENCESRQGIWLKFGKTKELPTLKASEALEEALCFGWIDGVIKRVDENSYLKYFSSRRKNSKWSLKNKELAKKLEKQGRMTTFGKEKIKEAKENGQWEKAAKPSDIEPLQIDSLITLLKENELAFANFQKMSPSIQKTYTRAYFDAKTEDGQKKRLAWIIDRLEKKLKPM